MYDDSLMKETGLELKKRSIGKSIHTNPSGRFSDPFGDDLPKTHSNSAAKFEKGQRVRSKFNPDTLGRISGVGTEIAAVDWENAGCDVCRFEHLILD